MGTKSTLGAKDQASSKMSEWKTLKEKTIEAGGNNFIEVNVKQPPERARRPQSAGLFCWECQFVYMLAIACL